MKEKYLLVLALIVGAGLFFIISRGSFIAKRSAAAPSGGALAVVQPDDGITPILAMIAGAAKSVIS